MVQPRVLKNLWKIYKNYRFVDFEQHNELSSMTNKETITLHKK